MTRHSRVSRAVLLAGLVAAALPPASGAAAQSVAYGYDALGRLTSASYDGALTVTYEYDAGGNIVRISYSGTTGVEPGGVPAGLPSAFALGTSAPSPFQGATQVRFQLPRAEFVSLRVFDVAGRQVRTLARGGHEAGYHHARWDGRDDRGARLASGVYFYLLEAGDFRQTQRVVLAR